MPSARWTSKGSASRCGLPRVSWSSTENGVERPTRSEGKKPVKIDVITIFPHMIEAGLTEGVVGRARTAGLLDVVVHNLRDFTTDKHHVVDDVPFGGGPGMVMKPEPFFAALSAIRAQRGTPDAVVMLTPAGERFTQEGARRLAVRGHLVFLCGRYEGIDERVREAL